VYKPFARQNVQSEITDSAHSVLYCSLAY